MGGILPVVGGNRICDNATRVACGKSRRRNKYSNYDEGGAVPTGSSISAHIAHLARSARAVAGLGLAGFALLATGAAPGWKPESSVELIAPAAAGGANDLAARLVQKFLQDKKLVAVPVTVTNKPGGAHTIGLAYLNQRPGDGHRLMIETIDFVTNRITGKSSIGTADVTPLALLFGDYITLSVRANSPVKSAADFVSRLKQDPASLSIALSSALANANHLAAAMVARHGGVDIRRMKIVVYNSGSETITAMLGGHIDVVAGPASVSATHAEGGKIRVLGISAPQRVAGSLATIPTFREQGLDAVISNWRSVLGPKGLSAAQIAFWDDVFGRLAQSDDWKKELDKHLSQAGYLNAAETRNFYEAQYNDSKALLSDLGLAK
jgi:putative tricarboxylic transport membrane protein